MKRPPRSVMKSVSFRGRVVLYVSAFSVLERKNSELLDWKTIYLLGYHNTAKEYLICVFAERSSILDSVMKQTSGSRKDIEVAANVLL